MKNLFWFVLLCAVGCGGSNAAPVKEQCQTVQDTISQEISYCLSTRDDSVVQSVVMYANMAAGITNNRTCSEAKSIAASYDSCLVALKSSCIWATDFAYNGTSTNFPVDCKKIIGF